MEHKVNLYSMRPILIIIMSIVTACHQPKGANEPGESKSKSLTPVKEQGLIELGGEKQYVEMNGDSESNPVVLFLHGGPGWPQTPHLRYFNSALTQHVTLVAWEQSGCGKSYLNNPEPAKLSLEQTIKDAHELTQVLKQQFHKNKIYLIGFSWGSIPGMILAEKYPEDYAAYFGVTQVVNLRKSMEISRHWIAKQAASHNDRTTIEQLKKIEAKDTSACKRDLDCFIAQYELLNKYGGAIFTKKSEEEIAKAEKYYKDYEKYDWYKAFFYSAYRLENDLFNTDLSNISTIRIPVYFLMGKHDWNIPPSVTEDFYKKLNAPKKEMIWFDESGHEPLSEEAAKFNNVIIDRIHQL